MILSLYFSASPNQPTLMETKSLKTLGEPLDYSRGSPVLTRRKKNKNTAALLVTVGTIKGFFDLAGLKQLIFHWWLRLHIHVGRRLLNCITVHTTFFFILVNFSQSLARNYIFPP